VQYGEYSGALAPALFMSLCWLGAWLRHPEVLWSLNRLGQGTNEIEHKRDSDFPSKIELTKGKEMETFWRFAPWLSRLILLAVTLLFARLAWPALADPFQEAATHSISLGSAEAVSRIRIGFGATTLASAIIAFVCLISPRRVLTGLYFVLIWVGVITVVRIIGVAINGPNDFDLRVLRPEVVILALTIASIFIERGKQRRELKSFRMSMAESLS
jgi:hypothetical protein